MEKNSARKKAAKYERLYIQIKELTENIPSPVTRMATINAVLYHKMKDFFWVGFYLLDQGELIVGPYQGPLACLKLKKQTGVCWKGIDTQVPVVVPNVHNFEGHIACDSRSNSELVVPLFDKNEIKGVIDIDSTDYDTFDEIDAKEIQRIIALIYS